MSLTFHPVYRAGCGGMACHEDARAGWPRTGWLMSGGWPCRGMTPGRWTQSSSGRPRRRRGQSDTARTGEPVATVVRAVPVAKAQWPPELPAAPPV